MLRLQIFAAALALAGFPLAPTFCHAQTQPPPTQSSFSFSSPELDALAARVAALIEKSRLTEVLVTDFVGPKKQVTELGVLLADQLSRALAARPQLKLLPRQGHVAQARGDIGTSDDWLQERNLEYLAQITHGELFVLAEIRPSKESIQVSLAIWEVRKEKASRFQDYFAVVKRGEADAKLLMTPTMQSHLAISLPPPARGALRLSAGLGREPPNSCGPQAGLTNSPSDPQQPLITGGAGLGHPECMDCPPPSPPKVRMQGTVVLQAIISVYGCAENVVVLKSGGTELDERAIEAVRKWRYKPTIGPNGVAVPIRTTIEVHFRLR